MLEVSAAAAHRAHSPRTGEWCGDPRHGDRTRGRSRVIDQRAGGSAMRRACRVYWAPCRGRAARSSVGRPVGPRRSASPDGRARSQARKSIAWERPRARPARSPAFRRTQVPLRLGDPESPGVAGGGRGEWPARTCPHRFRLKAELQAAGGARAQSAGHRASSSGVASLADYVRLRRRQRPRGPADSDLEPTRLGVPPSGGPTSHFDSAIRNPLE